MQVVFQPLTSAFCNRECCLSGFGGGTVTLSSRLELLLDAR